MLLPAVAARFWARDLAGLIPVSMLIAALASGRQLVLIRKGGLIEPGTGFELVSPSFVFYPTFEHQTVSYVRPEFQASFERNLADRAPQGSVRVSLFGIATASAQVTDPSIVPKLSPFHIYNDAFLSQRLKWQPEMPLVIAVIRAYRLPTVDLPVAPHYAGCKSWVDLDSPVSLEGATPVLADAAFEAQARQMTGLLHA